MIMKNKDMFNKKKEKVVLSGRDMFAKKRHINVSNKELDDYIKANATGKVDREAIRSQLLSRKISIELTHATLQDVARYYILAYGIWSYIKMRWNKWLHEKPIQYVKHPVVQQTFNVFRIPNPEDGGAVVRKDATFHDFYIESSDKFSAKAKARIIRQEFELAKKLPKKEKAKRIKELLKQMDDMKKLKKGEGWKLGDY